MAKSREMLGPKNAHERRVYAEEYARLDAQMLVWTAMKARQVGPGYIAKKLGWSKPKVKRLLSDRGNPTVRQLAAMLHVCGFDLTVEREKRARRDD